MISFFKNQSSSGIDLLQSELFDDKTFYKQFITDLQNCRSELIIESPFIASSRMNILYPIFEKLVKKGLKIYIITRNPLEHEGKYVFESELAIQRFENLGIQVLLCDGKHHRKLAILDRKILWEGSLNILSQTNSREIMRRIDSLIVTQQMLNFLEYYQYF